MFRKLSALLAGVLLCSLASSQSVPNGGIITSGQVWTTAQWNNAWQSKFDVTGGTLTAPTITNPAVSGGTFSAPAISGAATVAGSLAISGASSLTLAGSTVPAVNQSPTWTGNHTFTPASGIAATFNGKANSFASLFAGSATSGQSFGLDITAGTTSADESLQVNNTANSARYLVVFGDGGTVLGSPTGGDKGVGTLNATNYFKNNALVPAVNDSPSWTANHTFTASSGTAITINGSSANTGALVVNGANCTGPCQAMTISGGANNNNVALAIKSNSEGEGLLVFGNTVAGQSHGITVLAGTNSSDAAQSWGDASGATAFGTVWGDGGWSIGPVGTADCGAGCLNASQGLQIKGVPVNAQLVAHLPSSLSITSNTTPADILAVNLIPGTYAIESFLQINGPVSGAQGLKVRFGGTASLVAGPLGSVVGSVAGVPQNTNTVSMTYSTISGGSSLDYLVIKIYAVCTVAGTFTIQAAQNTSSANATLIGIGSYLMATKT